MGINLLSPTTFTSAVLIGDTQQTTGGSNDSIPSLTKIGGNPISAALEIQSTAGGLVVPRMTTAQVNALANPTDGMAVYDTNLNAFRVRQNGAFGQVSSQITINITAAQFIGMSAAPIVVLPAPAAGYAYVVVIAYLELVYGTAQFTGGGVAKIQYGNAALAAGTAASGTIAAATFTGAAASTLIEIRKDAAAFTTATANMVNQGLTLSNATAAFATGDSTFNLTVVYNTILI